MLPVTKKGVIIVSGVVHTEHKKQKKSVRDEKVWNDDRGM